MSKKAQGAILLLIILITFLVGTIIALERSIPYEKKCIADCNNAYDFKNEEYCFSICYNLNDTPRSMREDMNENQKYQKENQRISKNKREV